MIVRFLVGSVAFHLLYYTLKNIVVPAFFRENAPKVIVAEIAKRSVIYSNYVIAPRIAPQTLIVSSVYMDSCLYVVRVHSRHWALPHT